MIRRLVLHIGRHKTGTSAIQRYLAEHRAAYAEAGVIVPEFGGFEEDDADPADRVAHHRIALDCGAGTEPDPAARAKWREALTAAAEGGDTLVLSSEVFQNVTNFALLRELTRDFYVEVVCYLREYLDYALSSYAQDVKKVGVLTGFFEYERRFNPQLRQFVARWSEFANRCHWRLYERGRFEGGDVVRDFLKTAGLPDFGGSRFQEVNPRIGGSLLGFKLIANGSGLHSTQLARALEPLASSRPEFRMPWRLDPRQQEALRARRDYNAILRRQVGDFGMVDVSTGALPFNSPTFAADMGEILAALDTFPKLRANPLLAQFVPGN